MMTQANGSLKTVDIDAFICDMEKANVTCLEIDEAIEAGIDINSQHSVTKRTALHSVVAQAPPQGTKDDDVLGYLLARGANLCARDCDGRTPFIVACMAGNKARILKLLAAGASVHATDDNGWTPLLTLLRYQPEALDTLAAVFACSEPELDAGAVALEILAALAGAQAFSHAVAAERLRRTLAKKYKCA